MNRSQAALWGLRNLRIGEQSGALAPAAPPDGALYWFSQLQELGIYHQALGKWLSARTITLAGSASSGVTNAYISIPGGLTMSATMGYKLPFNATLVEVYAQKGAPGDTPTYEVRANGSAKTTFQLAGGEQLYYNSGLRVDFSKDDIVSYFVTGTATVGAGVTAIFRRRL
jgi:hypothetical protein